MFEKFEGLTNRNKLHEGSDFTEFGQIESYKLSKEKPSRADLSSTRPAASSSFPSAATVAPRSGSLVDEKANHENYLKHCYYIKEHYETV